MYIYMREKVWRIEAVRVCRKAWKMFITLTKFLLLVFFWCGVILIVRLRAF